MLCMVPVVSSHCLAWSLEFQQGDSGKAWLRNCPQVSLLKTASMLVCRHGVHESKADARCWGPVFQGHFLQNLGIAARLEALIESTPDPAQQETLYQGAMRLVTGSQPPSPPLDQAPASVSDPASEEDLLSGKEARQPSGSSAMTPNAGGGASKAASLSSEEGTDSEDTEGLGFQYMAMAVAPSNLAAPVPFDLNTGA